MTLDQKVQLVADFEGQYGQAVCCRALSLNVSTYQYRKSSKTAAKRRIEDERIYQLLQSIVKENPGYGYRPMITELREKYGENLNHKRLRRLLNQYELSLPRTVAKNKPSPVSRVLREHKGELNLVKGSEYGLLKAFSTDFTELKYAGGKATLMAIIDIKGKSAIGWSLAPQRGREMALKSWSAAKDFLSGYRTLSRELVVHSDQDSVYTSYEWLDTLLLKDGVSVSFSENGSRDNPWIESFWSRLKDELGTRIAEARSLKELEDILKEWFEYYNHRRRHSALGYQPPMVFLGNNWEGCCLSLSED